MKLADTLRGLWRRRYIVVPGLIVAAALTAGTWYVTPPGYERTAVQLLLPGADSIPEGGNPYLFLGGLSPAADVLVRALKSENVLNEVVEEHPGVKIEISRDFMTAGPVILIVVTSASDASAEQVLALLVGRTATTLNDLQETENIQMKNRVTVLPITVDSQSMIQQRSRFIATGAAGLVSVTLTLLLAGFVDGLSTERRRRRASMGRTEELTAPAPASLTSVAYGPASTAYEPSTLVDPSRYDDERAPAAPSAPSAR